MVTVEASGRPGGPARTGGGAVWGRAPFLSEGTQSPFWAGPLAPRGGKPGGESREWGLPEQGWAGGHSEPLAVGARKEPLVIQEELSECVDGINSL